MSKGGWDMTSTHSLLGAATWLLKKSGAIAVVIVRAEDAVMDVDPRTAPRAAAERLLEVVPELTAAVNVERHRLREELERKKGGE